MSRTTQVTTAAVMLLPRSLLGISIEVLQLTRGTAVGPGEAPFATAVFSFALNIGLLFSAYLVWQNLRWGKILAVALCALNVLYGLLPVMFAPFPLKVAAVVGIMYDAVVVVLLLWRARTPVAA